MVLTVPHAGEPHLISGLTLLKNSGDPIFTLSPSLTISLGLIPLKSVGRIATVSDFICC